LKLLIISGPTATGKTTLAIKLAKKFNGELISADSRQIYRGMDIGTGKDHPKDVKINLIDIINPDQTFSVEQYRQLALEKISEIHSKNKLPIIVGGTGQYIDSITNPQPTFSIKPNKVLRFFLNHFPLKFLQLTLRLLDFKTFKLLNNSDLHNPRRLVRKIEIKFFLKNIKNLKLKIKNYDTLHVSLTAPNDYLYSRIDQRVESRLKLGLIGEIKNLLKKYKWSDPGLNCLAYKEFVRADLVSVPQKLIDIWRFHEHAYARRQKTWFKKIPGILFFDITLPGFEAKIIKQFGKWYNNS
jgi:tRNA dimethylallyltransferase